MGGRKESESRGQDHGGHQPTAHLMDEETETQKENNLFEVIPLKNRDLNLGSRNPTSATLTTCLFSNNNESIRAVLVQKFSSP